MSEIDENDKNDENDENDKNDKNDNGWDVIVPVLDREMAIEIAEAIQEHFGYSMRIAKAQPFDKYEMIDYPIDRSK